MVFTIGIDDTLFAIDADSGKTIWQKSFPNSLKAVRAATSNCANTEQATPVIDKKRGVIYFTTSDGKLRGASLSDGAEKLTPIAFVAPFSRNWSLNLIDNVIYTASGRGCGGDVGQSIEPGSVSAMDVSDPAHPQLSRFLTGRGRPAGPWGRGGPVAGPLGVYVQTADGNRAILRAAFSATPYWRCSPRPMAWRIPLPRRAGRISTPRISIWARAAR